MFSLIFYFIFIYFILFYLYYFCFYFGRYILVQGINFAILAKFLPLRLFGCLGTFQLPNCSIKSAPPPPPPPSPPLILNHTSPSRALQTCPLPISPPCRAPSTSEHADSPLLSSSPAAPALCLSRTTKSLLVVRSFCTPEPPAMVRTRGGHRSRPRVQTSTPARDGAGTSRAATGHSPAQDTEAPPALTPDAAMMQSPTSVAIPKESQGTEPPSRRYHTRVGPRPPSPVHLRPPRRAPPSKRARTSGSGESSCSKPEPSPLPTAQSSSPQLSPASRIRRPMFSCDPIPRNVNCRAKDFHGESHYDIPALAVDPRFKDSMRLV